MKRIKSEWVAVAVAVVCLFICAVRYLQNVPPKGSYSVSTAHAPQAVTPPPARRVYIPDELIDVNTAGLGDLISLPGIGHTKAMAILKYRVENGPFQSEEDLLNVRGIGPATLEKMKPYMTLSKP